MANKLWNKVFLYGTLKRGEANHYLLTDAILNYRSVPPVVALGQPARYLGRAATCDRWPLVAASEICAPFLLDSKGTGKVGL